MLVEQICRCRSDIPTAGDDDAIIPAIGLARVGQKHGTGFARSLRVGLILSAFLFCFLVLVSQSSLRLLCQLINPDLDHLRLCQDRKETSKRKERRLEGRFATSLNVFSIS